MFLQTMQTNSKYSVNLNFFNEHQGCLWASWGIHGWGAHSVSWVGFLMEPVMQLVGFASIPFNALRESRLSFFQPLFSSHAACNSVLCTVGERNGLPWQLPAQWGAWSSLTCSLPTWGKSQANRFSLDTELCYFWGTGTQVKSNCSFTISIASKLIFFFFFLLLLQCCAGTSPLETWTSTKALLSLDDCLRPCSLEVPRPQPRRAGAGYFACPDRTEVSMPIAQHAVGESRPMFFGILSWIR